MATTRRRRLSSSSRGSQLRMDEVEEILTRLPAREAVRCKLLSKAYNDLISKPSFANKHILHHHRCCSSNTTMVIVYGNPHKDRCDRIVISQFSEEEDNKEEARLVSLPLRTPHFGSIVIVGSCNGLLVHRVFELINCLGLVNPATMESMSLPPPILEHKRVPGVSYIADALGFGYDAKHGDYKVVKIADFSGEANRGPCCYLVETWTMKTNTWKQISPPTPSLLLKNEYNITPHYALVVGGILHWLAFRKDKSHRDALILSFDPSNDTFGQIALPKDILARRHRLGLNVMDFMGSLALSIGLPVGDSQNLFEIWVMNDDTMVWTKRFSIGPFPLNVLMTRLCINGNFVLHRYSYPPTKLVEFSKFILYDPHHNTVQQEVPVDEIETNGVPWSFTESLVSIPHHQHT